MSVNLQFCILWNYRNYPIFSQNVLRGWSQLFFLLLYVRSEVSVNQIVSRNFLQFSHLDVSWSSNYFYIPSRAFVFRIRNRENLCIKIGRWGAEEGVLQCVVNEILNFPSYLPSFFENKKEKWQYFHTWRNSIHFSESTYGIGPCISISK